MNEEATALRRQMVARLTHSGVLVTPTVIDALARVPRHVFLPRVDYPTAYRDRAVMVKYAEDGLPLSSASQPTIVATMLEQLRIAPGHRVLEIGTGTGYNAALLAALVRDEGYVASVELEPDLAEQARHTLALLGEHRVDVLVGDGRDGHPSHAPYDRVIVTTGARMVADSWADQMVTGGRLIVPLIDERGVGFITVLDKVDDRLERSSGTPCRFLPIRNAADG